ncbi:MAG: RecQ family ATP-dependent DNA helicase [Treponema sp.]|jgi:ATP-dependent DNA helicase RecQ|nr:RecQ family ATP-dependent DNA helicase [Treponema sp.]
MTDIPLQESVPEKADPLSNAVSSLFGLSYLFPYQRLVVANILEAAEASGIPLHWPDAESGAAQETAGENAPDPPAEQVLSDRECPGKQIVILPTGAGKSLCFQLPAMLMEGPTLVIYPILSLMADQERRLRERGFSPVILRGGQTKEERDEIWKKLRSGQSKFIIANPEVLLTPQVMTQFERIKVVHTVIDEAHCVSEWGETFRPSYLEINSIIKTIKSPLVTAFTATASKPVLAKIKKHIFGDAEAHQIIGNPDRPNITYTAKGCIVRELAVRDLLITNERPAIVFCSSRPGTEKLAGYLRNGLRELGKMWHNEIKFYHAGLSREEKADVGKWFLHNSRAVLIATCAFGMGVDKADIRTVIHQDCPPSVEAYLQEAGRAGRDGGQSKAILLWGPDDETSLRRAGNQADRKRVAGLLNYARNTSGCRRQALLKMLDYDGKHETPESLCCDVCEKQASDYLREELSLTDFFRKNKMCFTANEAAGVLARAENIHWSAEQAGRSISHLVKAEKLKISRNIFWKNKITIEQDARRLLPPRPGDQKRRNG